MSNWLEHFGLDRPPFADESPAVGVIGTRALRRIVARIQAALRDGQTRIGVLGPEGIGKSSLALALPKLFAGHARVATVPDPTLEWPTIRNQLARDWQLEGSRLSRTTLLQAAQRARLVLVLDRAETAPDSLLDHLDVLQGIADERSRPVVTTILFVRPPDEPTAAASPALAWLERQQATRLPFEPLTPEAVADYIQRKLRRAGHRDPTLFTPRASLAIHAETGGVPGAVSRLCSELLEAAAARRLRSIDEPFVRARGESIGTRATVADETGYAWDDADHHPRETSDVPTSVPTSVTVPTSTSTRSAAPAHADEEALHAVARSASARPAASDVDPELEAYLSAPPTEAELRAIRGGFLRRVARPFLLAALAVTLGGLALALGLRGQHATDSAANEANAGASARASDDASPPATPAANGATVAQIDGRLVGRLRGPIDAASGIAAHAPTLDTGSGHAAHAPTPTPASGAPRRPSGDAARFGPLVEADSPLRRARDVAEAGPRSAANEAESESAVEADAKVSELPDLRPAGLAPPADPASPDSW